MKQPFKFPSGYTRYDILKRLYNGSVVKAVTATGEEVRIRSLRMIKTVNGPYHVAMTLANDDEWIVVDAWPGK